MIQHWVSDLNLLVNNKVSLHNYYTTTPAIHTEQYRVAQHNFYLTPAVPTERIQGTRVQLLLSKVGYMNSVRKQGLRAQCPILRRVTGYEYQSIINISRKDMTAHLLLIIRFSKWVLVSIDAQLLTITSLTRVPLYNYSHKKGINAQLRFKNYIHRKGYHCTFT